MNIAARLRGNLGRLLWDMLSHGEDTSWAHEPGALGLTLSNGVTAWVTDLRRAKVVC